MNTYGVIATIIVGLIISFLILRSIYEYKWNQRLKNYQDKHHITHVRQQNIVRPVRRGLIGLTLMVMLGVFIITGTFDLPQTYHDKTLLNARIVRNEHTLRNKIDAGDGFSLYDFFPGNWVIGEEAVDQEANPGAKAPDVVGTNLQVLGVDEADIIKTDGYEIFYTPRYQSNRLYRYEVNPDGSLTKKQGLDLLDVYMTEFYLTTDSLVVIGYFEENLNTYYAFNDAALILPNSYFYGYRYSSIVRIYDRTDLSLDYELKTIGDIQAHRIIDDTLYMVSYNRITKDELRPQFTINKDGETHTSYVGYEDILIFDAIPAYNMTTISSLNLDTLTLDHTTVVGVYGHIYMTKTSLYIAGMFTYYPTLNTVVTGTHITKFSIDSDTHKVNYSGSTILEGYVENQFWLDEYEGLLRVVTTRSWGQTDKNRLYVLKEHETQDTLEHYGLLDEGIGKPEERVTSVRFDKYLAYVVTYRQIDPLYTIDISNPKDIKILNEIEEPGYNTYLHVWDETHLIGIGYDETFNVKISAYNTTNTTAPLETYLLSNPDENAGWSYSEALSNHKAILVSPEHGFIGFAANTGEFNEDLGYYEYSSQYYLFYIDFNTSPIIQNPYIITHASTEYTNQIDRGIYINNIFYTFSSSGIVLFDGETKVVTETYKLNHPVL